MTTPTHDRPRGYEAISELAKKQRTSVKNLIALSRQNDPFFVGSPAQRIHAQWFTDLWRRFSTASGMHLRRFHYQAFSVRDVRLPNQSPYENTTRCWEILCDAARFARILHMLSPDDFVDRRNPDPHLFASTRETPEPYIWIPEPETLSMPAIGMDEGAFELRIPDLYPMGYDYQAADQRFHLEVWAEKSTMDDILVPLCRNLGINYVTSVGFQSITSETALLRRARDAGKPVRLFYISDFDAAGSGMPKAVSRQLEFWFPNYLDPGADVKLTPLALTRDQVDEYALPNRPGEAKSVNDRFELQQGRGVCELDALEAIVPGTLARIVSAAVGPYRDTSLPHRLAATESEARTAARREWKEATELEQEEIDRITAEVEETTSRYTVRVEALAAELAAELEPLQDAVEAVSHAIQEKIDAFLPNLPERPEPETEVVDESLWLFDSSRDYLEQLRFYKQQVDPDDEEVSV